ncbi:MAG TPA: bacillithiol biosynthesis cysteine-adding enzyme BshC [Chitinophagaceae bacterium]|nr:bacillithiol biosynthesis cysteine-adding enzyme BshC [Chitinophagaceae bacterium]
MDCISTRVPYQQTGYFSKIVLDYLDQSPALRAFYSHDVNLQGIQAAIEQRKAFNTDRKLLQTELQRQYSALETSEAVTNNIRLLANDNTFTICTAHQPNIFTGNLYFIYKILHAIKLADTLKLQLPQYHFVPVFYMGCEDADLDELGHIHLNGEKLVWDTKQTGAVGRMNTKGLEKIIHQVEGQIGIFPHGKELITLLKQCYLESPDIQTATFKLVNALFADYGLVVLIPDNPNFKRAMRPVFEEDLLEQIPSSVVQQSVQAMDKAGFKVQAHPREINLFYLKDNVRERIIQNGSGHKVNGPKDSSGSGKVKFSPDELQQALQDEPEVFSPNVILRGLFQETILPDVAFIGGGGELAYWLELKGLFDHYHVPFPVLVLRNSFLVVESNWKQKMDKLQLSDADIFLPEQELMNVLVKKESGNQLTIQEEIEEAKRLYEKLKAISGKIDVTLAQHVSALETSALNKLKELEKKLLRAERRKFSDYQRQVNTIKQALFPNNSLQERVENFLPYYARWGRQFFDIIYRCSGPMQDGFVVINVRD